MPNGNPRNEMERLEKLYSDGAFLLRQRDENGKPKYNRQQVDMWVQKQSGGSYRSLEHVIDRQQRIESAPSVAQGVAQAALQGVSFGTADELVSLIGGKDAAKEYRRQASSFREEHPVLSYGSEIAGGFLVPGLGSVGALKRGKTFMQAAGAGALAGAGEGAAVGFFEGGEDFSAEGMRERAGGAVFGGIAGGVLGGVLGGAFYGGTKIKRFFKGQKGITPTEEARKIAQEIAEESGLGVDTVLDDLARMKELNPNAVLADHPAFTRVAQEAAGLSPEAGRAVREVLPARQRHARNVLVDELYQAATGDAPMDMVTRRQDLAERFTAASKAYDDIATSVIDDIELDRIIDDIPAVRKAFRRAERVAADDNIKLAGIFEVRKGKLVRTGSKPDFTTVQAIKSELESQVTKLYKKGNVRAAQARKATANEFYEAALNAVEGFGETQTGYARLIREREAMDIGSNILRKTAREIEDDLASMSEESARAYMDSALSIIARRVRTGGEATEPTKMFRNPEMMDRLVALIPDEGSRARFMNQLDVMKQMHLQGGRLVRGAELQGPSLVDRVGSQMGRTTAQRVGAGLTVAPALEAGRLAGEIVQRGARKRDVARARDVSTVLGPATVGRGVDAENLLRGGRGDMSVRMDIATRSPRALLNALLGG